MCWWTWYPRPGARGAEGDGGPVGRHRGHSPGGIAASGHVAVGQPAQQQHARQARTVEVISSGRRRGTRRARGTQRGGAPTTSEGVGAGCWMRGYFALRQQRQRGKRRQRARENVRTRLRVRSAIPRPPSSSSHRAPPTSLLRPIAAPPSSGYTPSSSWRIDTRTDLKSGHGVQRALSADTAS